VDDIINSKIMYKLPFTKHELSTFLRTNTSFKKEKHMKIDTFTKVFFPNQLNRLPNQSQDISSDSEDSASNNNNSAEMVKDKNKLNNKDILSNTGASSSFFASLKG